MNTGGDHEAEKSASIDGTKTKKQRVTRGA
jgi:hypothetical protein